MRRPGASATAAPTGARSRARGVRDAWPVAAVLAQKLLFWAFVAERGPHPLLTALHRWDAVWYLGIAEHGYHYPNLSPAGRPVNSNLAFFPLYPLLGRAVAWLPGVQPRTALLAVAMAGTLATVRGLQVLGTELDRPGTGIALGLLWAVVPRGFLEAMPYSEAPFTACTVWALVQLARGRLWWAALWCCAAGLTRPTAVGPVLAVEVALLVLLVRSRRPAPAVPGALPQDMTAPDATPARPSMATLVGSMLLAGSGLLLAVAHVAYRTRSWTGYLTVQRQWNLSLGTPMTTWWQWQAERHHPVAPGHRAVHAVAHALPVWTLLLVLALAVAVRRPRWAPAVGAALVTWLMMAMTQTYFQSKERYLLPAVGCLVPVALLVGRLGDLPGHPAARRGVRALLALAWLGCAVWSASWGADVVLTSHLSP